MSKEERVTPQFLRKLESSELGLMPVMVCDSKKAKWYSRRSLFEVKTVSESKVKTLRRVSSLFAFLTERVAILIDLTEGAHKENSAQLAH